MIYTVRRFSEIQKEFGLFGNIFKSTPKKSLSNKEWMENQITEVGWENVDPGLYKFLDILDSEISKLSLRDKKDFSENYITPYPSFT